MATNFIVINRNDANAIFANDLVNAVRLADQLYAQLEKIKNKMDEMIDGDDYSQIETLFGVQADLGSSLHQVVSSLLSTMSNGAPDLFRSRLG